jgi:hypothetical protein
MGEVTVGVEPFDRTEVGGERCSSEATIVRRMVRAQQ